jgi:hypothetical protein
MEGAQAIGFSGAFRKLLSTRLGKKVANIFFESVKAANHVVVYLTATHPNVMKRMREDAPRNLGPDRLPTIATSKRRSIARGAAPRIMQSWFILSYYSRSGVERETVTVPPSFYDLQRDEARTECRDASARPCVPGYYNKHTYIPPLWNGNLNRRFPNARKLGTLG